MTIGGSRPGQEFLQAVMSHLDMVHTLARRLTRNREDAEDLVQEVMVRAYAARRETVPQSMGAWLATICLNTARSAGRRQLARPQEYHDDIALARLPAATDTDLAALANLEADKVRGGFGRFESGVASGDHFDQSVWFQYRSGRPDAEHPARDGAVPSAPRSSSPRCPARR